MGCLEPEVGQTLLAALDPLARPADAHDTRTGSQRTADALAELARRSLEGGRLPRTGGVRPQLAVVVELDSLLGQPGAVGGDLGGSGPLAPEACRRLACDGAITRVVVRRQPGDHVGLDRRGRAPGPRSLTGDQRHPDRQPSAKVSLAGCAPSRDPDLGLEAELKAAMARLPRILGGAPAQPLDLGRTTRVVSPAQRTALAVRDGGCGFPGCARPLSWCEADRLRHWLHGGRTDLENLALLCRAHHRAVHEGGWRLVRAPDGGLTGSRTTGDIGDIGPRPDTLGRVIDRCDRASELGFSTVPGRWMAPKYPGHRAR